MIGKKIKVLRADNGGEYTNKAFTRFYVNKGITREWKTPYNPQQNGVVEQKEKIIVGEENAMLYD